MGTAGRPLGFSDPTRLLEIWGFAIYRAMEIAKEADRVWRMAVDGYLASSGVFGRVNACNMAIDSPAFQAGFVAHQEERAAARDEEDLRNIALDVLGTMGVDLTDVVIRLRRLPDAEVARNVRRVGGAQIAIRGYPTVEAAQRAIDAARDAGFPQPGSAARAPLVTGAGGDAQTGQGTSGL